MSNDYSERTKLAEAKQMRKRADEDARLLANRIALLKQEELKAQKKIEETKRKAKEIVNLRSKNTEMLKLKEDKRQQQEEEERTRNERNKQFRDQNRNFRFQKAVIRQNRAASEANALKKSHQQNLEEIENVRAQDLIQKATLRNFIRSQHREAEERKREIQKSQEIRAIVIVILSSKSYLLYL